MSNERKVRKTTRIDEGAKDQLSNAMSTIVDALTYGAEGDEFKDDDAVLIIGKSGNITVNTGWGSMTDLAMSVASFMDSDMGSKIFNVLQHMLDGRDCDSCDIKDQCDDFIGLIGGQDPMSN